MYSDIENMKVTNLLCKHVSFLSPKAKQVLKESEKIGYKWCLWGTHSKNCSLSYHINKIQAMEKTGYEHSIRIVICKYPFSSRLYIWTDNLHSTIMQIRKHGLDVKVKDIPHYIVDISEPDVVVFCNDNTYINTDENRKGVIECAFKRYRRSVNKKLLNIGYTVEDFINDNKEILE